MRVVAHNGAHIWGGAERATVDLLSGLAGRGHEVLLLCSDDVVIQHALDAGVAARRAVIGGDLSLHHAVVVARALRSARPDVFIIGTYRKLFLAALAARLARVPLVVARIGLETDTPRSAKYRVALRRWVDRVVVNGRRLVPAFEALGGFGDGRVRYIPNGVRPPRPAGQSGRLRSELGIAADAYVIGTVARLARQKRIDRLLQAVALLPDAVHCIVAGEGSERRSLETLARTLGVQHRVHFVGHQDDPSAVYAALDTFVVASDREGLSNAMLEAMAHGLPVVSTPVSGADEAVGPDLSGAEAGLLAGFSPESLAGAVEALRADETRRLSAGECARERAAGAFSFESMLDGWEACLAAARGSGDAARGHRA